MIYGYSERGIFNSIIYYLEYKRPDIIGEFLDLLLDDKDNFKNGNYEFTFLNEQSFSDFGDSDLTIIAKQNDTNEKTVIFVEGKRGKNFSLETERGKINEEKFSTSNLFIQLYFKYLLAKGNDIEPIDDYLNELISKTDRKIGTNKVVLKARDEYIKNTDEFYYVAIVPKQKEGSKTLQELFKELKLMTDVKNIKCAFWQNVEKFFKEKNAENVIENFKHNEGQIY